MKNNQSGRGLIVIALIIITISIITLYFFGYEARVIFSDVFINSDIIINILSIVFSLSIFFIAVVIFLEKQDPAKTIAWLLILAVLPILGFFLYLLIGRKVRKRKIYLNKELDNHSLAFPTLVTNELVYEDIIKNYRLEHHKNLLTLLINNNDSPFTNNNKCKVLNNGDEAFAAIFESLEKAEKQIHIESFIIRDDNLGNIFKKLLIKKAKEGLEIRLIYDGVGSWRLSKNFIKDLHEAGIETACFNPIFFPFLHYRIDFRNHRKIIIVDGHTGFVGGLNIGDEYIHQGPLGYWRDTHLKIEGEAIYYIQKTFVSEWEFVSGKNITKICIPDGGTIFGQDLVQIANSGPDSYWESISQVYFATMSSATDSIYFYTPYLIPNESILTALKIAALSGVDVRIIVPSVPDKKVVYWATKSYFEELLQAGVKIYRYQKGFLHSKALIVDGVVASIGSANMDLRSFKLDFELNALIYSSPSIDILIKEFFNDIKECEELAYESYKNRGIFMRFKESLGRLISPLL